MNNKALSSKYCLQILHRGWEAHAYGEHGIQGHDGAQQDRNSSGKETKKSIHNNTQHTFITKY